MLTALSCRLIKLAQMWSLALVHDSYLLLALQPLRNRSLLLMALYTQLALHSTSSLMATRKVDVV